MPDEGGKHTRAGTGRFDARAYWEALSPAQQRAFGEMALVTLLAWESREGRGAARLSPQVKERWGHAVVAIWNRIAMLIPDVAKYPEGPDLAALGIRACRVCGATRQPGNEEFFWAAPDLCGACCEAEPAPGVRRGR